MRLRLGTRSFSLLLFVFFMLLGSAKPVEAQWGLGTPQWVPLDHFRDQYVSLGDPGNHLSLLFQAQKEAGNPQLSGLTWNDVTQEGSTKRLGPAHPYPTNYCAMASPYRRIFNNPCPHGPGGIHVPLADIDEAGIPRTEYEELENTLPAAAADFLVGAVPALRALRGGPVLRVPRLVQTPGGMARALRTAAQDRRGALARRSRRFQPGVADLEGAGPRALEQLEARVQPSGVVSGAAPSAATPAQLDMTGAKVGYYIDHGAHQSVYELDGAALVAGGLRYPLVFKTPLGETAPIQRSQRGRMIAAGLVHPSLADEVTVGSETGYVDVFTPEPTWSVQPPTAAQVQAVAAAVDEAARRGFAVGDLSARNVCGGRIIDCYVGRGGDTDAYTHNRQCLDKLCGEVGVPRPAWPALP